MNSIRTELVLSHVVPLIVLIPFLGLLLVYIVETQVLLGNLADDLAGEAVVLAEIARQGGDAFRDKGSAEFFARAAGAQYEHNVTLFASDGTPWMNVIPANDSNPPNPTPQEVKAMESGKVQKRIVFSIFPANDDAEALAPVMDSQQRFLGIIRVTDHLDRLGTRLTQMRLLILGATAAALIAAIFVSLLLAARTTRRLETITNAITNVAEGRAPPNVTAAMPTEFRAPLDAVNRLQSRLQVANESRKRLLANLVHELGRPLAALQAAIHALQQGADGNTALRQELLQGMDSQVERLKPLVENLAGLHGELSGATVLQRAQIDLNEWLPQVAITWRQAAEQKGLNWREEHDPNLPMVNMDADRMAQVVGNLLSNAIKYTPEGGAISLTAGHRTKEVWIAVQDTGSGIAPEDLKKIFDPLYRGSNSTLNVENRFPQGMGLGLAIARDIVQAHGGRIEVQSEVGKGSKFTVFLESAA